MFQCCRSPRSITITTPNIFQRALYIQNIQIGNWQDWFSNSLLFYTECLNNLDGICYYKCCIQPKHEDHHRSTLLRIRDIPKYSNASKNFFPLLSFSLFLQLAFYNYLFSIFTLSWFYNHFHNILRLFDVLPNFLFTKSETICDYYLKMWYIRVASRVGERL